MTTLFTSQLPVTERVELEEAAYQYLMSHTAAGSWLHIGDRDSRLSRCAGETAKHLGIELTVSPALDSRVAHRVTHCFLEADRFGVTGFADAIDLLVSIDTVKTLCGTGFLQSDGHRQVLLEKFPGRLTLAGSLVWWAVTEPASIPKNFRGALCLPCFQDNWRVEENFAWRSELVEGLDVHIFDDNFEPAESERLRAVARHCDWHYHRSELGEHPDFTGNRTEFSEYNRFIWESLTGLADQYDFVVKLDTDACFLERDWWHEMAARLSGRDAMLGTFDFRPISEVEPFWELANRHGYTLPKPEFPLHLQGGMYAISRGALHLLKAMGFLLGQHHGFGEDGYMSYCAQCLGIELLPATTFGSWSYRKRPPLNALRHLKAMHPLMRREWPAWNQKR